MTVNILLGCGRDKMNDFNEGELSIQFDGQTIAWFGKSIFPDPSKNIDPYFDRIIPQMNKQGVVIRFDQIKFLCSATLHSIIKLIKKLNSAGYKITMVYNKDEEWQRVTFKAFHALSRVLENFTIITE